MKKWTALMMAVTVVCVMGISGCTGSGNSGAAETTAAAEESSAEETAPAETAPQETLPVAENPDFSAELTEEGNLEDSALAGLVTLPDYKNAEFTEADVRVSDDEVESQVESVLSSFSITEQVTDREVRDGDRVNIDYVGSIDGVEFDGGSTGGIGTEVIIGTTSYIDDFLEQLIGHKPGETIDVNVTFPDEYPQNPDLAGKDALFVTTINYIRETVTPELTDEFVAENLRESRGYESVDDMKAKIREDLEKSKAFTVVWQWLLDESEFSEIPESIVNAQLDIYEDTMNKTAYNNGMSLDDFLAANGVASVDDLRESYRTSAEQIAKQYVITQAISDNESLTVPDEEVTEYFGEEDAEKYRGFYGPGYIKFNMKMSKIAELIMETAALK